MKKFDLEERTTVFSERIIQLCRVTPKSSVTIPILDQLIRCGTSIGANYSEANGASSKKDFRNKVFICKKEARETKYWLRLLSGTVEVPGIRNQSQELWNEADELTKIFSSILLKAY